MNRRPFLLLLPLALPLCGCLLGPDYVRPEAPSDLPSAFRGVPDGEPAAATGEGAAADAAAWWRAWDDPLLVRLLDEGTSTNLTLREAQARLRQSRASLDAARATLRPTLGLSGSATRARTYDPDETSSAYRAGADAGWEIDLFGRNRRTAEASAAELEAAGLTVEDARLSLRAEIASDYVALRLAQETLALAHSNLAAEVRSAEIARAKGASGFSSGSDVAAAEASIATARAALPARVAAVSAAARALERLLARPPFALEEELAAPAPIPGAPPPPVAAPAETLARRPDVRKAAAALHAATARIGAARAARYPSVNLAAGAALSAASLSEWSEAVKSLSLGPTVSLPLFRGGALAAAERQARAAADEALLAYHDTVLAAVHETQELWTRFAAERERTEPLSAAVARDEEALEAALELYRAGKADYTAVIVRQTALFSARQALAQHRADLASLAVSLAKAVGGFPPGEEITPPPAVWP